MHAPFGLGRGLPALQMDLISGCSASCDTARVRQRHHHHHSRNLVPSPPPSAREKCGRHFFGSSWSPEVGPQRRRQGMSASPRVLSRRSCVRVVVAVGFFLSLSFFIFYWDLGGALRSRFSSAYTRPRQGRRRFTGALGADETTPTSPPRSSGLAGLLSSALYA